MTYILHLADIQIIRAESSIGPNKSQIIREELKHLYLRVLDP